MPIIKSAKKRVRSSARKRQLNSARRRSVKEAVKQTRVAPSAESLKTAFKALDKAAKRGVVHKNRVARLKSRLAKLVK
ncbi:TPA: 30S ribosomal protein S20 [Patescibacteria group bacterium]|uniref:Small ribosomal subunit protein bS20 n=2 Tax=Bacteria division Kazan-3B-28 TaxID=1798534 RepID=A0A0G1X8R9_UNCK3|nr:MAG: 30S ribosomal protein S20, small subunit ribosomal protein S20 [candidate division Kazan bacterium GW2011_GWA1_50_15]KKW25785.1 MAG: 30S ribosomal protein S20 [candidate division Kazan bacterium GW2011_GWC1_52_13]KKW27200.1 MAG: 30S ribosomal protein S20 [candidate division Kazan bacterium GW2011_GWB1_52_7]HCL47720.1 30S ribosomal protein S20 [Patescibacteria group bacterium]HCR42491.1 30S ribosomal protein S20 [Patescibacteria group bacterium]